MKNVTQQGNGPYSFTYCHAAWVDPHHTAGIFMSLSVAGREDEVTMLNFMQNTEADTDTLTVGIKKGAETEPVLRSLMMSPVTPGNTADARNRFVKVVVVDIDHEQEVLCSFIVMYGQNAFIPNPAPMDFYYYDYASAPYAIYKDETSPLQNSIYIIVSLTIREGDEVTGASYSAAVMEGNSDSFVLSITSATSNENRVTWNRIYGPYNLGTFSNNGVELTTSVNGSPPQRPIGIKSYGNGEGKDTLGREGAMA